ncbi:Tim44/TimA family putative adaptor protein [Pacificibacter marinus]|uniref:Tim44/TimA family putative adaptor protein n=1 Tax=Pacificibacter marinus TaxID=658057 RepID=UPI001C0724BA|nr:Tim44/TimA family putative adaptor protein [Pacificibacter marinus]MBU2866736.1 Tim44/TimA family putative adaptor protein [Pacificibacter marinus]
MGSSLVSLLVLAGIAIFLVLRLRNILGTRDGFEQPRVDPIVETQTPKRQFEVIEGGVDHDIIDNVPEGSRAAENLLVLKRNEPDFTVSEFLTGASAAYEMILMAFENGDLSSVSDFISDDVEEAFQYVIDNRKEAGLTVEAQFIGLHESQIIDVDLDEAAREEEIKLRFVSEITSVARDAAGAIVEGDPNKVKRQKDIWTFAREMGSNDPNWQLVATGA